MFKDTELIGAARRLGSVGGLAAGQQRAVHGCFFGIMHKYDANRKTSEQVRLCGAHTVKQEEANTAHTGQAAFTKCDGIS